MILFAFPHTTKPPLVGFVFTAQCTEASVKRYRLVQIATGADWGAGCPGFIYVNDEDPYEHVPLWDQWIEMNLGYEPKPPYS